MSSAYDQNSGPAKGPRCLLLLCCLLFSLPTRADILEGQVIAVTDAYRILLQTEDGRRLPVRLIGLDPPDTEDRDWRKIAKHQLHRLLAGRFVRVDFSTRDKQGVILGEVLHGGADVGVRLLGSGLAVADRSGELPERLRTPYLQAEEQARRHRMGFWQFHRSALPTLLQGKSSHE